MAAPSIKKETRSQKNTRLDPNKLDEWLETELVASGLLQPSEQDTSKSDSSNIVVKAEPEEIHHSTSNNNNVPMPLTAIFKAFATLTALQQPSSMQALSAATTTTSSSITDNTKTTTSCMRNKRSSSSTSSLDSKDEIALKRQRNTDAARRSRLRKVQKMEGLERRVKELQTLNEQLQLKLAVLESERDAAKRKQDKYEKRVHELETQLAEAHEALVRR
ncbi:hypothetical protein O0I10_000422 [Lichtheimia ornata]|uniref:BZIP domain-containing protein n=1 Tax=Lichtheimia ornata TaxID=688661 RepID=A0AAD8DJX4_9FUNG|nr:uncharacterized protein O0I10_000422 [Lichtheimia ornata]KAJ8664143.1 hypothetical protein O0I10_000422 [Lichtheimia ornata]